MSIRIFISYRHDDAEGSMAADLLAERLIDRFGASNVFYDHESLSAGSDWRKVVKTRMAQTDILLPVIGRGWGDVTDEDDPIRLELEEALKRDIPIIPLLVRGTPMPPAEAFPDALKSLRDRVAGQLGGKGESYRKEVGSLIERIEELCDSSQRDASHQTRKRAYAETYRAFLTNDGVIDSQEAKNLKTIAESANLSPSEVREIEAEVSAILTLSSARGDASGSSKATAWRLGAALVVGSALVLAGLSWHGGEELPAHYTLKDTENIWLNTDPTSCLNAFNKVRDHAARYLLEGAETKGTFTEPKCQNKCWMDSGSRVEVHRKLKGSWVSMTVRAGQCNSDPTGKRNQDSREAHEGWSKEREQPDPWRCCSAGDSGFAAWKLTDKKTKETREIFDRNRWRLPWNEAASTKEKEPRAWCRRSAMTPNERLICESSGWNGRWSRHVRESLQSKRHASWLSDKPTRLAQFQEERVAWVAERNACGDDAACTDEKLNARLEALANHAKGVEEVLKNPIRIEVTTTPPGATVKYGTENLGTAPAQLRVPRQVSDYPIEASLSGYDTGRGLCRVDEKAMQNQTIPCHITLFKGWCKAQAPTNSCGRCNTPADCGGMAESCWQERSPACGK